MDKTATIHLPYAKKNLIKPGHTYFRHQISITGSTGSGKSALVELLELELDKLRGPDDPEYEFLSAGKMKRTEALKPRKEYPRGFRLAEKDDEPDMAAFTTWEGQHPEFNFDEVCDQGTRDFSVKDFRVCEGRLAHLFMPHAFKILIMCNPRIRAERRAKKYRTAQMVAMSWISDRDDNDRKRYEAKYPGYSWNLDDYDLVIVNEQIAQNELSHVALKGHAEWQKRMSDNFLLQSAIIPQTEPIRIRAVKA